MQLGPYEVDLDNGNNFIELITKSVLLERDSHLSTGIGIFWITFGYVHDVIIRSQATVVVPVLTLLDVRRIVNVVEFILRRRVSLSDS